MHKRLFAVAAAFLFLNACSNNSYDVAKDPSGATSDATPTDDGTTDPTAPSATTGSAATSSGGTSRAGTLAGALFHSSAGRLHRYDFATKKDIAIQQSVATRFSFGYGGGLFLDTEVDDTTFTFVQHTFDGGVFQTESLPSFDIPGGTMTSVGQPSPDAKRLAFSYKTGTGISTPVTYYLKVLGPEGTASYDGFQEPVWISPTQITMHDSDGALYVAPATGGTARPLGVSGTDVAVSPDGKTIAYRSNNAIHRVNLDGTGHVQLTIQSPDDFNPAWSPDGKSLAVESGVCSWTTEARIAIISATTPMQDVGAAPWTGRFSCSPMRWL